MRYVFFVYMTTLFGIVTRPHVNSCNGPLEPHSELDSSLGQESKCKASEVFPSQLPHKAQVFLYMENPETVKI